MKKLKEAKTYVNIPVSPEVYDAVKLVSEANGYGERGVGAQVAHWVGKELPECEHKKTAVAIEYFPGADFLPGSLLNRSGYYCSTCKRVYAKVTETELTEQDGKKLLKAIKVQA
jgi:hypothetical protein